VAAAVANLTDARYFAALGVDYMGFALEPGAEGHISPMELAAFREWIEGPALVGEFGGMDTASIVKLTKELNLDVSWETLQADPVWIDWLTEVCADFPVLLDIPAPADMLDDILTTLEPVGVQVHGGEEEAVGLKSYDELDEWMEVLQVE